MEATALLITAIAALIAALAWPASLFAIFIVFRREIRAASAKIPKIVDRVQRLKFGALEAELERVANTSLEAEPKAGTVTIEQVRSAAKIGSQAGDIGESELLRQLDRLSVEYDAIRRTQPSGYPRTQAMTRVLVQMRMLGPAMSNHLAAYKGSGSAGCRLAAVAMMQMEPQKADIDWLLERFREEHPFIFYHAALALQNVANEGGDERQRQVRKAAQEALAILREFDGVPDARSIQVLEALKDGRPSGHDAADQLIRQH